METVWIVGIVAVVLIVGVAAWWTRPATWQDGERRGEDAGGFLSMVGDLLWWWWVW